MQLPIVKPAPIITTHAEAFRHLFENQCQFRHFQNYLTGLIVLPNKSLANISRCIVESADKTNLSRFFSQAPWSKEELTEQRIKYLLSQTVSHRLSAQDSHLLLDDTLCEHVGSLFEYVDRHYNHSNQSYPLAHNLVTSHYLSGAVRFPVDLEIYRRYEEVTRWSEFVNKYFPELEIPKQKKERQKLHKLVDQTLLKDPEFQELHNQFQTKITLAVELIEQASQRNLPFTTVLMDSWYLTPELVATLKKHQLDWVSLLKKNRKLEVNSFVLRDEEGQPITLTGPHIKVEDLVPLIPPKAYRKVKVGEKSYWCFTRSLRIPGLGKVRLVISFENPELTGTYAVLVTNRTDWSAKQILTAYLQRWPIETFYQDSKGHLGLDEYRMRSAEAIQKHWCLVFVAYSLLHLACLPTSLIPSKEKILSHPIKTIGEVCRQQGQRLIEELILLAHKQLQGGQSASEVFSRLFAKHRKEVPA
ncbi:MAG: transposase [Xenococcaceae cyanobacterium]